MLWFELLQLLADTQAATRLALALNVTLSPLPGPFTLSHGVQIEVDD